MKQTNYMHKNRTVGTFFLTPASQKGKIGVSFLGLMSLRKGKGSSTSEAVSQPDKTALVLRDSINTRLSVVIAKWMPE